MERKSLKKNTKLSLWEEMAPSSNETLFQGLFFFVGAVLVWVGIRTDETSFEKRFRYLACNNRI